MFFLPNRWNAGTTKLMPECKFLVVFTLQGSLKMMSELREGGREGRGNEEAVGGGGKGGGEGKGRGVQIKVAMTLGVEGGGGGGGGSCFRNPRFSLTSLMNEALRHRSE